MREVQRIERAVNLVIGKPLTWTLYGLWLATKHGYRAAIRLGRWVHDRYQVLRKAACNAQTGQVGR
jgi:hypothetical protein